MVFDDAFKNVDDADLGLEDPGRVFIQMLYVERSRPSAAPAATAPTATRALGPKRPQHPATDGRPAEEGDHHRL
jgi:hypothetical protein